MNFKELIIKRKSIRKYDMTPVENDLLTEIEDFLNKTNPLVCDSGKFGFMVLSHDDFFKKTGGMFRCKAPHYIVFFGDGSDDSYKNIGFAGELAALKLTEKNIGTCWLGGAKSKEKMKDEKYTISIAFGKPLESFRQNKNEAKRKALEEIAEGYQKEQLELLESVRLAPSAMNFQPWYFKCENNKIHIFRKKTGGLLGISKQIKTMQKIDIGIATAHFKTQQFNYKKLEINDKEMIYEGTVCLD